MRRLLVILSFTVSLLAAAPVGAEEAADRTSVFRVEGMTCRLCAKSIEKALHGLDGVRDVSVDRKAERVTVQADASVPMERLEEAIESAGGSRHSFEASPLPQ